MTTVHAQLLGDQALIPRTELEKLVELASQGQNRQLEVQLDELPSLGILGLAQGGKALDWLADEPDLYSANDLRVRYR
jgi:hypothetical protein